MFSQPTLPAISAEFDLCDHLCIGYFSVAVIKCHDQNHLIEGRVYLGFVVLEGESIMVGDRAAGSQNRRLREQNRSGERP